MGGEPLITFLQQIVGDNSATKVIFPQLGESFAMIFIFVSAVCIPDFGWLSVSRGSADAANAQFCLNFCLRRQTHAVRRINGKQYVGEAIRILHMAKLMTSARGVYGASLHVDAGGKR